MKKTLFPIGYVLLVMLTLNASRFVFDYLYDQGVPTLETYVRVQLVVTMISSLVPIYLFITLLPFARERKLLIIIPFLLLLQLFLSFIIVNVTYANYNAYLLVLLISLFQIGIGLGITVLALLTAQGESNQRLRVGLIVYGVLVTVFGVLFSRPLQQIYIRWFYELGMIPFYGIINVFSTILITVVIAYVIYELYRSQELQEMVQSTMVSEPEVTQLNKGLDYDE